MFTVAGICPKGNCLFKKERKKKGNEKFGVSLAAAHFARSLRLCIAARPPLCAAACPCSLLRPNSEIHVNRDRVFFCCRKTGFFLDVSFHAVDLG